MTIQQILKKLDIYKGTRIIGTVNTCTFEILGNFEYDNLHNRLTCDVRCVKGSRGQYTRKNKVVKGFILYNGEPLFRKE